MWGTLTGHTNREYLTARFVDVKADAGDRIKALSVLQRPAVGPDGQDKRRSCRLSRPMPYEPVRHLAHTIRQAYWRETTLEPVAATTPRAASNMLLPCRRQEGTSASGQSTVMMDDEDDEDEADEEDEDEDMEADPYEQGEEYSEEGEDGVEVEFEDEEEEEEEEGEEE